MVVVVIVAAMMAVVVAEVDDHLCARLRNGAGEEDRQKEEHYAASESGHGVSNRSMFLLCDVQNRWLVVPQVETEGANRRRWQGKAEDGDPGFAETTGKVGGGDEGRSGGLELVC
jgi:hypothetical protein